MVVATQLSKNKCSNCGRRLTQKAIWMPTLFLFLWQCTPTAESAFFYFSTNELGFTPEFLGRVRLGDEFGIITGRLVVPTLFKNHPVPANLYLDDIIVILIRFDSIVTSYSY